MTLQIILLVVYVFVAWTISVIAARAYYRIIYLKLLLTQRKAPLIIEIGVVVLVFIAGVLLALAGEIAANAIAPLGDNPGIISNIRLFMVVTVFFGMFYFQLYRDRQNLINKLKDKQFVKQAMKKMQGIEKKKKRGTKSA